MYVFERQIWFILTADWLLFWVYYQKSQEKLAESTNDSTIIGSHQNLSEPDMFGNESIHQQDLAWNVNLKNFVELRFANLMDYCIPAFIISYLFFFGIGGYLHVSKKKIIILTIYVYARLELDTRMLLLLDGFEFPTKTFWFEPAEPITFLLNLLKGK